MENPPRLISRLDSNYQDKLPQLQRVQELRSRPFGEKQLNSILTLPASEQTRGLDNFADYARERIRHLSENEKGEQLIEYMLTQVIDYPQIKDTIKPLYDDHRSKELPLSHFFSADIMPNPLILDLILANAEYIDKTQQQLEAIFAEFKSDFQRKLSSEIQRRKFLIDESTLEKRLSSVKPLIFDFLNNTEPSTAGAQYDPLSQVVRFYPHNVPHHVKILSGHELAHASAGITFLERQNIRDSFPSQEIYRGGVRLRPYKKSRIYPIPNRFMWLNEALTENLHLFLYPEDANYATYEEQRMLLNALLVSSGRKLSVEPFYQAYFEDYDDSQQGMPGWQRMVDIVDEVYSKGFLAKLDNYVRKNEGNLIKVINVLITNWRDIT